jgi:hypothetical protein
VALEHNSLGAISVNDVETPEESLGLEFERRMELDDKVEEKRTHEPLDFRLQVDHGRVDVAGGLQVGKSITYIVFVFVHEFFVCTSFQEFKYYGISPGLSGGRTIAAGFIHVTRT